MTQSNDASTMQEVRVTGGATITERFLLEVVAGPDLGVQRRIDGTQPGRLLIGQSPACALVLTDRMVSRRHAALEVVAGGLRLTDLGSTNGTRVAGVRVVEAIVEAGAEISLGATKIHVVREPSAQVEISSATQFGTLLGASQEMRRLYPLCQRLAETLVPAVIEGETGTGKEVLAEAIHARGPRADAPFVVFDCTMVSQNLIESELFGHERGAFTGATTTRQGLFEQADGGTLLIDEIGDLDPSLQPKLLRVLQRSEVRRVGGNDWIPVDVRVIAATRRELDREVQDGRFRDDLFFRLAVGRIELPPLRHRTGDIAFLARHFWRELSPTGSALPYAALQRFEAYSWPGNVRELTNAVARHAMLGELELVRRAPSARQDDNPFRDALESGLPLRLARQRVVDEFEHRYVSRVLQQHGGNAARAADASGIARRYFNLLRARARK